MDQDKKSLLRGAALAHSKLHPALCLADRNIDKKAGGRLVPGGRRLGLPGAVPQMQALGPRGEVQLSGEGTSKEGC